MRFKYSNLGRGTVTGIRPLLGKTGTMMFCFPFSTALSNTIMDCSRSRRWDSEAIGSGISVTPGLFGTYALRGDGTSASFVRLRSLTDTDPPAIMGGTDKFTIAMWVNFSSFAATRSVYGESVSTVAWTAGSSLYANTAKKLNLEYFDGSYHTLTGSYVLTAGLWYHIAFTKGTVGRAIYVNGALDTSNTDTNNANATGGSQLMCNPTSNSTTASNPLLGDMCCVVAYDQDMGPGFIKRLYQQPLNFLHQYSRRSFISGGASTGIALRSFSPPIF